MAGRCRAFSDVSCSTTAVRDVQAYHAALPVSASFHVPHACCSVPNLGFLSPCSVALSSWREASFIMRCPASLNARRVTVALRQCSSSVCDSKTHICFSYTERRRYTSGRSGKQCPVGAPDQMVSPLLLLHRQCRLQPCCHTVFQAT